MQKRTSRKQVEDILKVISTNEFKYELIPIEFCGKWKYFISTYTREPKLADSWGRVYTYTDWKHKERVLELTTLKKAYEFSCELLHKINFEGQ